MSREIKFRAWDGEIMIYSDEFNTFEHFFAVTSDCGGGEKELIQFTGLKDCDGTEIYEGDFVSVFDRDDNEFLMSGVVKFGFRGYPGFDIYDERGDTYTDEYNTFTNDDDLYFKVTGNIYQNPERFNDTTKSK